MSGTAIDDPRNAAARTEAALEALRVQISGKSRPRLPVLMALRDDLEDPALLSSVAEASRVNDRSSLTKLARTLAAGLGRKEAEWKVQSELAKEMGVVGGGALIVSSIGAMTLGPLAVAAMIGAGLFTGYRGYSAVKELEKERHEYEEMKKAADKIAHVLDKV